ncbi:unnamed protein product [Mortierella alpina]
MSFKHYRSIYTTIDKTFYLMPDWTSPDFFALDLTRSWTAAEAPLQLLPALPVPLLPDGRPDLPFMQISPLVVNNDKKSLIYFDSNRSPSVYNITTKTWQLGTLLTAPNTTDLQRSVYTNQVATDPSTGVAYILSMENLPGPSNPDKTFTIYTHNTLQDYTTDNKKITSTIGFYFMYTTLSAVWSSVRKSVLVYGYDQDNSGSIQDYTALMEYQPSTNNWTELLSSGSSEAPKGIITPGATRDACMASAYNGTKIVLFGTLTAPYSVFILDVKTLVWTKGAAPKPGQERNGAVCTVVDNYFIVAGGTLIDNKQRVLVYNIKLDQWTDTYEAAPQSPTTSTGVETASPVEEQTQHSGDGIPLGAKIGIIVGASGALVVTLICGALLIRRRKIGKSSHADVKAEDLHKKNIEWTEKGESNPKKPIHRGKVTDSYLQTSSSQSVETASGRDFEHAPSHHSYKSTREPSRNPQQHPMFQNKARREASSSPPDGVLRIQEARSPQKRSSEASSATLDGILRQPVARNPQYRSSCIPAVAVQHWQCTQQGHNLQHIPLPSYLAIMPALTHHPRYGLQDGHGDYHERSNHRVIYHDQRRDQSEDGPVNNNLNEEHRATDHGRHGNDPQACYGDNDKDQDYLETYQDPRMNAPQEHSNSSSGNDLSFYDIQRRLNPQDHTRHSAASRLEFYQSLRLNNPQDHGDQNDEDHDTLYQEIQRIRAQQEEHMLQEQNLERVRLEKEEKLHTLAGRVQYPSPRAYL